MRLTFKILQSGIIVVVAMTAFCAQYTFGQQLDSTNNNSWSPKKTDNQKKTAAKQKGFFEGLRGTIDFGGHFRDLSGSKPGKFVEFKDFRNAPNLRNLFLKFESATSPMFFAAKAQEVGERDERFTTDAGRIGKYRFHFMWEQVPQYYSTGTTLHTMTSPGLLTVDPTIRAALQSVPDASNPPQTLGPTLPNLVRQFISTAPAIQLRTRSDQLLVTQSFRPNRNWDIYFQAQHLRMNGTRPKSTGTFARQGVGPAGDGVWETLGVELPEPVQYRTTNLTFGFQYSQPKWRIGLDYNISLFRNE
ncbi:MAG TPA: MtrB/PioB family outer membrane beta-barrel protein, partial [Candidatus Dormibacteraeota bacterium]|nr:MtrB/PioB family outer membrane beta-barrel protein [Candidatus Dormibacteraeota bacterium]